jgi:putative hydrolase of HD superfamily
VTDSTAAKRIVDLISELDSLESLPRMGFLLQGVVHAESVAAHCYGVALTAMLMVDAMQEPLDAQRVLRMALLHEVSEARITDLPYRTLTYIDPRVKSAAEGAAARDLLGPVDETYVSLWQEFEGAKTLEARVVRAADKIQMMVKVLRYDREGQGSLADFWRNVEYNENDWGIQLARELFGEIRRRHDADIRRSEAKCCG